MDEQDDMKKMSPRGRLFMALVFFFFGLLQFALVFGWIHTDTSQTHTPRWVMVAASSMFIFAGILILLAETERLAWLRNFVIWMFVLCLALPFNWVAFGEGERKFSSASSFLGLVSHGSPGEGEGRFVFGLFALLMDLIVLLMPLRALFRKRKAD